MRDERARSPETQTADGPGRAAAPLLPSYAIVTATRNRADALAVSIPLFLGQTRPPARLVIVDRSDDHETVRDLCLTLTATATIPVEVIWSDKANAAYQRNLGLDRVREDIVMFPDDDAFWYPDTAERILNVYAADTGGLIGGVTAIETDVSPVSADRGAPKRTMRFVQRPMIQHLRNRLEALMVPQPFNVFGAERIAALAPVARSQGLGMPFVETLGGFRMSFRTETARALRFDDLLGSRVGYAQHEDKDLSLRVLAAGQLLAAAPGARVFHNVHPGKRANGFAYGFFQIFNYAFICAKVFPRGSAAMRSVQRYCRYKVFLYGLRRSPYDRDVARGARAASSQLDLLLKADPADLPALYDDCCDRCLP